eukprot:GEMP01045125.1.p1 GENE.GEMP01045125.1~~GEMP01045125.1.p1  ORF type:complete len:304 (+),score=41.06 GEMP01045125.1:50-913(+)
MDASNKGMANINTMPSAVQKIRGQNKELAQRLSEETNVSAQLRKKLREVQTLFFAKVAGSTATARPPMKAVDDHKDSISACVSRRERTCTLPPIPEIPAPACISAPQEKNGTPVCLELSRLLAVLEQSAPCSDDADTPNRGVQKVLSSDPSANPQIKRVEQMLRPADPGLRLASPRLPTKCGNGGLAQQHDTAQQGTSIISVNCSVSRPTRVTNSACSQEPRRIQFRTPSLVCNWHRDFAPPDIGKLAVGFVGNAWQGAVPHYSSWRTRNSVFKSTMKNRFFTVFHR